ncbi:MAG: DUF1997 domain-containing protein [Cyanobacteria bacterium J06621_8]
MLSKLINHSPDNLDTLVNISNTQPMTLTCDQPVKRQTKFAFAVSFQGRMDMYSDIETVAEYLNAHQIWFKRCAQPMKVEPLCENGYVLTVGKYGSFGYEVEPKMGVVLQPPVDRVYLMHTVPLDELADLGYGVEYNASMKLEEHTVDDPIAQRNKALLTRPRVLPSIITKIDWQLDLQVEVEFPKFIAKLSSKLLQSTGDRLLAQIVRQVSPRLMYKVQQDFHSSYELPMPSASSRQICKTS